MRSVRFPVGRDGRSGRKDTAFGPIFKKLPQIAPKTPTSLPIADYLIIFAMLFAALPEPKETTDFRKYRRELYK